MNKHIFRLFIVLGLFVIFFSCSKSPEKLLVGKWNGTDDKGKTGTFRFYKNGNAEMILGQRVVSGEKIGGTFTWQLDESYNPIHLDLVIDIPSKEPKTMPMIIQFLSDNEIQLAMSNKFTSRPFDFSDSGKNKIINLSKK